MTLSTKLNIKYIFWDHIATLCDGDDETTSIYDVVTFYGIPLLVSFMFWVLTHSIDERAAERIDSIVVSAFSIFAALLLNVQVLIIGLKSQKLTSGLAEEPLIGEDAVWTTRKRTQRDKFISDVFSNVSYAIATSIILVGFTILLIFCGLDRYPTGKAIQLYGIIHFVLTLLMILKRMHIVIGAEIKVER